MPHTDTALNLILQVPTLIEQGRLTVLTLLCQPIKEICQKVRAVNKQRPRPRILLHTDAAQAIGKIRVDVNDLGVDYMTIVGHKVRHLC